MNVQLNPSEMAFWSATLAFVGGVVARYAPPIFKWLFPKRDQQLSPAQPSPTVILKESRSLSKDEHETLCAERMKSTDRRLDSGDKQFERITSKLDEQYGRIEVKIDGLQKMITEKFDKHESRIKTLEQNAIIGN